MAKKIMVDGMVFEAGFQGEVPRCVAVHPRPAERKGNQGTMEAHSMQRARRMCRSEAEGRCRRHGEAARKGPRGWKSSFSLAF